VTRAQQRPLGVVEVLLVVMLTLAAVALVGSIAVARLGAAGVLLAELGFVFLPTVTWLWARAVPLPSLGLQELGRGTPLRVVPIVGALLAGGGTFYILAALVEPAIERVYPTPPALREALERMVLAGRPLYVDIFTMALAPAVAEELLFRGALFEVARRHGGTLIAIVVAALGFALYHGSPHRFAPAFAGGLLLGCVRALSGSLVPAIVFHAANNTGVLVALHLGWREPPLAWLPSVTAVTGLIAGFALLRRWTSSGRAG
jgi:membrane protease YdiL (CAAX protease family)